MSLQTWEAGGRVTSHGREHLPRSSVGPGPTCLADCSLTSFDVQGDATLGGLGRHSVSAICNPNKPSKPLKKRAKRTQRTRKRLINGPNLTYTYRSDRIRSAHSPRSSPRQREIQLHSPGTGAWPLNPSEGRRLGTAQPPHRSQAHCVRRPRLICKIRSEAPTTTHHATPCPSS